MSRIQWRGVTTKHLYKYDTSVVPAAFINPAGGYEQTVTINAETAILANTDGSVARSVAGAPPVQSIYDPGVTPSPWEQA